MDTLKELVGPKGNTSRWIESPAPFNCHTCGAPQAAGTPISRVFHGQGEFERGEWEWNTPDCEKCEISQMISHYVETASPAAKTRYSERDFNEYTRESWEEWAARPVPVAFEKLLVWIAERDALMRFQKKLARLQQPEEGCDYYDACGDWFEKRERVDWWKGLRVPALPEKPELAAEEQIWLAVVKMIDPNHPIVAWLD